MKNKELVDLYAILTAGGRNSGERSTAVESKYYRNPADTVEFEAEIQRQKKAKRLKKEKQSKHRNYRRK